MVCTQDGNSPLAVDLSSAGSKVEEPKQAFNRKRDASSPQDEQEGPTKKRKGSLELVTRDEIHPVEKKEEEEEKEEGKEKEKEKEGKKEKQEVEEPKHPQRLTTPDLEFDYDKCKLKDPRPTPGREARPRYEARDLPAELAARRPPSPVKPEGPLDAVQKEELYNAKVRNDPAAMFHDLYRCYDKGPEGSPTYDTAGFQLDYEKVADWVKPRPCHKKPTGRGMSRSISRTKTFDERVVETFFEDIEEAREKILNKDLTIFGLIKDTISKDLAIPWHKIGNDEVDLWGQKGFKKHKVEDWLTYSDEDRKRYMKMLSGMSLRK